MQGPTKSGADNICCVTIAEGANGHKQYHPYIVSVESLSRMASEVAAGPEEPSEAENHRDDRICSRKKHEAGRVDLLNIEHGSKNNLYVSMFCRVQCWCIR